MGKPFPLSPRGLPEDPDFFLVSVSPMLKRSMWSIIYQWSRSRGLTAQRTPAGWFEFYDGTELVAGPLTLAESAAWLQLNGARS